MSFDPPRLRTLHTLEPMAWHCSHWPGGLVNRGGGGEPRDDLLGRMFEQLLEKVERSEHLALGVEG